MYRVILVLLILLTLLLPPGATVQWKIGRAVIIVPIGWCVLASLIATVLASVWAGHI